MTPFFTYEIQLCTYFKQPELWVHFDHKHLGLLMALGAVHK